MNGRKFTASVVLSIFLLLMQVHAGFAAPKTQEGFVTGVVTALACETDTTTGITTFLVTIKEAEGTSQTVRIDQATAQAINLIKTDENGSPDCNAESLMESIGWEVAIAIDSVIPDEQEPQHPVGSALATFFDDITDYETIMGAHKNGVGFGVIAQALWLTQKLEGDNDVFLAIIEAKQSGDFSEFTFEDGTTPENWGQFKKVVMAGKKGNLGDVMSATEKQPNGQGNGDDFGNKGNDENGNGRGNGKNKDKDDKGNGKGK
ncbi:MAG: hypothetical protein AB1607_07110 [Chloroflexota bacterium]